MWDKLKIVIYHYLKDQELEKYENLLHNEIHPSIKSIIILTKQAFNIYNARAGLPSVSLGEIRGFEKLLEELNKTEDTKVCIHRILSSNIKIFVFTSFDITRVLGLLTFPKEKQ